MINYQERLKEYEEKKQTMLDDYKLDKVLDKVKETIVILKFDETKVLIDTVNKLLISY